MDAWIWAGDAFYGDDLPVGCGKNMSIPGCNCNATWLQKPPFACNAGNLDNFREKAYRAVSRPTYMEFLEYMCPGYLASGVYPPIGDDVSVCPKPILATWDDHDYGWNDGNYRLPQKAEFKETFLSAVGTMHTHRYNPLRGVEWAYTMTAPSPAKPVEVILLDERYNRDTLPCFLRKEYCEATITNSSAPDYAWCEDFLVSGGLDGYSGSCCKKDEMFGLYCMDALASNDPASVPYFQEVCNVSSPTFGYNAYEIDEAGNVVAYNQTIPGHVQSMSSFCEMLGPQQRRWLEATLAANEAPLTLVVSGSVVLTNAENASAPGTLGFEYETRSAGFGGSKGPCGGDDWSCYYRATSNFLATLARYQSDTCYIIVTGDWHFSDIKVLDPSNAAAGYQPFHAGLGIEKPIWQLMASGMTNSTVYPTQTCEKFKLDDVGYRPLGECSFVRTAAYGMLEFLWDEGVVLMQIRDSANNGTVLQQVGVDMATCAMAEGYTIDEIVAIEKPEPIPESVAASG
jgi:alkaline phosphatase D